MSEQNNVITLYPSNWLYNAGVVGLLSLLNKANEDIDNFFVDGCVAGNELLNKIELVMQNKKSDNLPPPLNNIPIWHWFYIQEGFNWVYGGLRNFIRQNLRKASSDGKKTQLKKQLKIKKEVKFGHAKISFSIINNTVDEVYSTTFGRNAKLDLENAENKIFEQLEKDPIAKNLFLYRKFVGAIFSKTTTGIYQNYFHNTKFDDVGKFIDFFKYSEFIKPNSNSSACNFCSNHLYELSPIKTEFMAFLFPNYNEFPNAYWNNDDTRVTKICGLCKFMLIHHHLAFISLSDSSQIFINAPSFKIMYELNKLVSETYGTSNLEEARSKREILATSIIEYSRRITSTLGLWTEMNIELVTKTKSGIDFFSLPYDVVRIISDRRIAALLSELGEFKILNKILDRKFSELVEIGYLLLRESTKDFDKRNKDLIRGLLYRWNNQSNLTQAANKILKLYSLIEEKIKRS